MILEVLIRYGHFNNCEILHANTYQILYAFYVLQSYVNIYLVVSHPKYNILRYIVTIKALHISHRTYNNMHILIFLHTLRHCCALGLRATSSNPISLYKV